jgi:hypothetical protein
VLCTRCKYPETTIFVKQKQLFSTCRACGNTNNLDGSHRAGAYLIKANHKGTNEIDDKDKKKGKNGAKINEEEQKQEEAQPKEPEVEEIQQEANAADDGFKLTSPEIRKYFSLFLVLEVGCG